MKKGISFLLVFLLIFLNIPVANASNTLIDNQIGNDQSSISSDVISNLNKNISDEQLETVNNDEVNVGPIEDDNQQLGEDIESQNPSMEIEDKDDTNVDEVISEDNSTEESTENIEGNTDSIDSSVIENNDFTNEEDTPSEEESTLSNENEIQTFAEQAASQEYVVIKNREVNVYSGVGSSKVIGKLYGGQNKYKVLKRMDLNWISIQYAGTTGYIRIADITFTDGSNFNNANPGLTVYKKSLTSSSNLIIYSGANESSETLGFIQAGQQFETFGTNGPEFIVIDVGGRLGFVKRKYFQGNDQYIRTENNQTNVYANTNGTQVIGTLKGNNNDYRIDSVINDGWATVHFAGTKGYVRIQDVVPKKNATVKNPNPGLPVYKKGLSTDTTLVIYATANSNGEIIGTIESGQAFETFGTNGPEFVVIDIGGRLGFVERIYFQEADQFFKTTKEQTPVYADTSGKRTIGNLNGINEEYQIAQFIDNTWMVIHYAGSPGYVRVTDVLPKRNGTLKNPNPGLIVYKTGLKSASTLPIYSSANSSSQVIGTIASGQSFKTYGTNGPEFIVVDVGGRLGFVKRVYFQPGDQFIKTEKAQTILYSDTTGTKSVGNLNGINKEYRIAQVINDTWAVIHFAGSPGYVRIQDVSIKSRATLKNPNPGLIVYKTGLKNSKPLPIYSSSSTRSEVLGYLASGQPFKTYGTNGPEFIVIDVGGQLGYVKRKYFESNDQYIITENAQTIIYADTSAKKALGNLNGSNEVYKITRVVNDSWAMVNFAGTMGYVLIQDVAPNKTATLNNPNPGLKVHQTGLKGSSAIPIFSGASKSSLVLGYIAAGQNFETFGTNGPHFIVIDIGGRLAFVERKATNSTVIKTTNYPYALADALRMQMNINGTPPQDWYAYYNIDTQAYITADALKKTTVNGKDEWTVIGTGAWNVRTGPSTSHHIVGQVRPNDKILQVHEILPNGWARINFYRIQKYSTDQKGNPVYTEVNNTWVNASSERTMLYLNPINYISDPIKKYQFLDLSAPANIDVNEANQKFLSNAGTLTNKASVFLQAAKQNNISEIYLISHSLLETGNGKSNLASGIPIKVTNGVVRIVDPAKEKPDYKVYNMYGVNAFDSCPDLCGAQKAYDEKWFSPDAAIIGGAAFVSDKYINAGQNTLYKMRWDPANQTYDRHQYATDIAWAEKQTAKIYEMYNKLEYKQEVFDIPVYK
ncbi:glucosaminidase domain-containing protein [Bacillus sp. IITD106]|nr:glucosaminidase domain-containing protein [Bacillus sp. IITD106]